MKVHMWTLLLLGFVVVAVVFVAADSDFTVTAKVIGDVEGESLDAEAEKLG